jgi:hypothetical protein
MTAGVMPGKETAPDIHSYVRLLRLYSRRINEMADRVPEDPRLQDAQLLAFKLFFDAASALHLADGTCTTVVFGVQGFFIDFSSMAVVARAALETYLTFHYTFVAPASEDEFRFRHSSWHLNGLVELLGGPAQIGEFAAQRAAAVSEADQCRRAICATEAFSRLSPRRQRDLLHHGKLPLPSIVDQGEQAGIGRQFQQRLYGLLSANAHSRSLSVWHIDGARSLRQQRQRAAFVLEMIEAIVCKMIVAYAGRFPAASAVAGSDPEAWRTARVTSDALCADDSRSTSD